MKMNKNVSCFSLICKFGFIFISRFEFLCWWWVRESADLEGATVVVTSGEKNWVGTSEQRHRMDSHWLLFLKTDDLELEIWTGSVRRLGLHWFLFWRRRGRGKKPGWKLGYRVQNPRALAPQSAFNRLQCIWAWSIGQQKCGVEIS